MEDKAKGRMKEAAGAFTGDEEKKAEGRAQQRKGQAGEEVQGHDQFEAFSAGRGERAGAQLQGR